MKPLLLPVPISFLHTFCLFCGERLALLRWLSVCFTMYGGQASDIFSIIWASISSQSSGLSLSKAFVASRPWASLLPP